MPTYKSIAFLIALPTLALLASCQSAPPLSQIRHVKTSEEAANIYVASYPSVPWSAISEKLEPKHNLSTADARSLAAVTTQSQISEFMSIFSAGLGLGLPSSTTSSVSTSPSDGVVTTTGSLKTEPGGVPSASGVTAISITPHSGIPDFSKITAVAGVDATTQLMAGTAVYQLAQILDNQISKSIPLENYQAHLVTIQVNLQPNGRNLPYDAYLTLTFMPPSLRKAVISSEALDKSADNLSPIIIYPLIIADALESSNVTRSIETIRQAALSLSGIVRNTGLNAGLSGGSDRFDAIFGADRNTLVTVGRVSDHTLRIRLGAQQQGTRLLAMVPRTQNISMVVFTRTDVDKAKHLDKLAVVTETTLVDAETGVPLPNDEDVHKAKKGGFLSNIFRPASAPTSRGDKVIDILKSYGFSIKQSCEDDDVGYDLLRSLDRGDYNYISRCLLIRSTAQNGRRFFNKTEASDNNVSNRQTLFSMVTPVSAATTAQSPPAGQDGTVQFEDGLDPIQELRIRRVLAELMTLQVQSRYSKLMIKLSDYPSVELPETSQLIVLKDDGSDLTAVVKGGANLNKNTLNPKLQFTWNNESVVFLPTALTVGPGGKDAYITFPSLVGLGLSSSIRNSVTGQDASAPSRAMTLSMTPSKEEIRFSKLLYLEENPNAPKNPVSVTTSTLDKLEDGTAKLALIIGKWNTEEGKELGLRITGADVTSVEPPAAIDTNRRAIPVKPNSMIKLTLANIKVGVAVQIRTIAGNDILGAPILLSVEPVTAK